MKVSRNELKKKALLVALLLLLFGLYITNVDGFNNVVHGSGAPSPYISASSGTIKVGGSTSLHLNNDTGVSAVTWSSSDSSIVQVSSSGGSHYATATGKKAGRATIYAKWGNGKRASRYITVQSSGGTSPQDPSDPIDEIPPEPVASLSTTSLNIKLGSTGTVSINNAKATDSYKWKASSGTGKVSVSSEYGTSITVSGLKVGTATITVYKGNNTFGKVSVTVENGEQPSDVIAIETPSTLTLLPGQSTYISNKVYPENAKNKTLVWTSNDNNVATVGNYGRINAIHEGTCTITVKAKNGTAISHIGVTVGKASEAPVLSATNLKLQKNEKATLRVSGIKGFVVTKWYSTNSSVVRTVGQSGSLTCELTGVDDGKATIYCEVSNGKKAFCTVTVGNGGESDDFGVEDPSKNLGTIICRVGKNRNIPKSGKWTPDDSSIATVTTSNEVKGKKEGSTKITDINTKCYYVVQVVNPKIKEKNINIEEGSTIPYSRIFEDFAGDDFKVEPKTPGYLTSTNKAITARELTAEERAQLTGSKKYFKITCTCTFAGQSLGTITINIYKKSTSTAQPVTIYLVPGKTYKAPDHGEIKWETSNGKIAKVSNGTITAQKTTSSEAAVITGYSIDGPISTYNVYVVQASINNSITRTVGESFSIADIVSVKEGTPHAADLLQNYTFSVVAPYTNQLTVNGGKRITIKENAVKDSEFEYSITAYCTLLNDGSPVADIKVICTEKPILKDATITLNGDESKDIITALNLEKYRKNITVGKPSVANIVSITGNTTVKGLQNGETSVQVTRKFKVNGNSKTETATVTIKVTNLNAPQMSTTSYATYKGGSGFTIPHDGKYTWKSSSSGVASVNNGVVKPKKVGTTTITGIDELGRICFQNEVTVYDVTINKKFDKKQGESIGFTEIIQGVDNRDTTKFTFQLSSGANYGNQLTISGQSIKVKDDAYIAFDKTVVVAKFDVLYDSKKITTCSVSVTRKEVEEEKPPVDTYNSSVHGYVGESIGIESVISDPNWVFVETHGAEYAVVKNNGKSVKLKKSTRGESGTSTGSVTAVIMHKTELRKHNITITIYGKESIKIDGKTFSMNISPTEYNSISIPYKATLGPDSDVFWYVSGGSSENEYDPQQKGVILVSGSKSETVTIKAQVVRISGEDSEVMAEASCKLKVTCIDDIPVVITNLEGKVGSDISLDDVIMGDSKGYSFASKENDYVKVTKSNIHLKSATSEGGKGASVTVKGPKNKTTEIRIKISK